MEGVQLAESTHDAELRETGHEGCEAVIAAFDRGDRGILGNAVWG